MTARPSLPPSDVSSGVGVAGLAGLFLWVMVCRFWPQIVDTFGLASPREVMDGPAAAMAALLFSGAGMIGWSLLVDKVHRRPSTGIDWSAPRPLRDVIDISITKIAGLWATWAVIGFAYCLGRWYWRGQYVFAMEVLETAAPLLFLGAIPYVIWLDRVLVNPRDATWHFGAMLIGREPWDPAEVRRHALSWLVKGFFCAFMISIVPGGFGAVVRFDWSHAFHDPVEFASLLIETMFMIDVQIAMVGYLVTMKPLDAQIRTANPHLAAWVAALICYPPFILMGEGGVLDYHHNGAEWPHWLAGQTALMWVWAAALVILTAIYAWATVAFGLRFSNLTYRGVLTNGPYRFTRHPAYLSKNAYWWLATLPFLTTSGSMVDAIRNTVILALVSAVYYWRARTEEKHLLAEDAKYREYHAWMAQHGPITSVLRKLTRRLTPRPIAQPAE
ncbi:isoprenylcysteine carboxylmethyltransferase family protein [Novosphingobium sp. B1]|uniref:methyltransferase family protein n=1 Tax=Novosphingobium sp. B1 TaxID=1938756 RepID=UPI0009D86FB2|nr:isoprenylcysteine carboxylmethyltransferase family protein [Novosphingobium sp. B1]SMC67997.1 Isoprenylcysteine carboxyl methyltransferase (ICMT) family protein [Novosphingobium sp. B1]